MEIGVIILAAGGSSRLGQPKQLLRFRGATLLRRAVEAALDSRASHCTVVLGANALSCSMEIADFPVHQEFNAVWRHGMASSIRAGVLAARHHHPGMDAVIVAPCDLPFMKSGILDTLIEMHSITSRSIVASAYGDTRGVPALFGPAWFVQLANLRGDRGAKTLFDAPASDIITVPFSDGAFDVDTEEDCFAALREWHLRRKRCCAAQDLISRGSRRAIRA